MANSITTGNIVVPLQAILDQLQGKLSTADLNSLTTTLIGARSPTVRPGDLITADFMNSILTEIAQIEVRLTNLEAGSSTTVPTQVTLIRIDGTPPFRVGDRVTAVGSGFSTPGSRNGVKIDAVSVQPVDGVSTATALVFDLPDPGLNGIARTVTLSVSNVDGSSASLSFVLQPPSVVPSGQLSLQYLTPPGGAALTAGKYRFTFKMSADVTQSAAVQIGAQSSAADWTATLIDPTSGGPLANPVKLDRANGTHFETTFLVELTVPAAGSGASNLTLSAVETTPGTKVNPAPTLPYSLTFGGPIPEPENRVALTLLGGGANVTLDGGTEVLKVGQAGLLNFRVDISNLNVAAGTFTNMALNASLSGGDAASWTADPLTQSGVLVNGPSGFTTTGLTVHPPSTASSTGLLFTITGAPAGQPAVNASFLVPLRAG
ncbi:hypothetical protein [Scleromatobacter humisilvae]|uniref:IPT/TIG domain-containing protein n=1 Tax=Scleromatobacter humisilvae TaxID=2897159 RepID=A0A9X2C433_9BURK|nr:hypothetical protein [Scleromatobacter humisilvae]MCK9688550.1 hypothetical protein [Scleromatobacter humisilvae]